MIASWLAKAYRCSSALRYFATRGAGFGHSHHDGYSVWHVVHGRRSLVYVFGLVFTALGGLTGMILMAPYQMKRLMYQDPE